MAKRCAENRRKIAVWNTSCRRRTVCANGALFFLRLLLCVIYRKKNWNYIQTKSLMERTWLHLQREYIVLLVYFLVCNLLCGLTFLSLLCSSLSLLSNGVWIMLLTECNQGVMRCQGEQFGKHNSVVFLFCTALNWGWQTAESIMWNICSDLN